MNGFAVCCAAIVLALPLVQGQTIPRHLKIEIPFDFYLEDKLMPAGSYEALSGTLTTKQLMVLKQTNGAMITQIFRGFPVDARSLRGEEVHFVFSKYDNDHTFLSTIRSAGTQAVFEVPKSRTEREHVRSTFTPVARTAPTVIVVEGSLN